VALVSSQIRESDCRHDGGSGGFFHASVGVEHDLQRAGLHSAGNRHGDLAGESTRSARGAGHSLAHAGVAAGTFAHRRHCLLGKESDGVYLLPVLSLMQSHRCDFAWRELLRDLAWTLAPVALFAIAMHAGVLTSLWPRPRPAFDTERTVLLHQADACRKAESAEVLLLGDSSCLMDVSARRLSERLGRPVLNLGTFSFLDLNAHALFLKEYVQHHPTPPRAVVLLLHPEALRRLSSDGFYLGALTNYWARREHYVGQTPSDRASRWMGVEIFRERFLGRLPVPLPGAYG